MKYEFDLNILSPKKVYEIPGSWTKENYFKILEICNFKDFSTLSEEDAKDFAIVALQEYEPNEAAEILLKLKFDEKFTKGQRQNIYHAMQIERIWEEYQDFSCHEKLFQCASLLHNVFPRNFPETHAACCSFTIHTSSLSATEAIENPTKTLLLRTLGCGLSERSILKRLFKENFGSLPFPEAEHILWQYEIKKQENQTYEVTLYSSWYWLGSLDNFSGHTSLQLADL
jgi:hypothetical protein